MTLADMTARKKKQPLSAGAAADSPRRLASVAARRRAETLPDVTDGIATRLTPTTVIRNGKVRAAGRRMDQVIVFVWVF